MIQESVSKWLSKQSHRYYQNFCSLEKAKLANNKWDPRDGLFFPILNVWL